MKKSCKKKKRKNSLKKILKGFTLVELLAVIVILAIIMVIAIPAVLNTMESARRKTFAEYVDKVSTLSQKQLAEDQMLGNKLFTECIVYNVKTGLELNNTGNYEGWVLINPSKNDIYVTLYDDNYVIIGYHYSDSSVKMDDYIQKKNTENSSKLTIEELCKSSSCSTCDVDGTSVDGNSTSGTGSYVVSSIIMDIGSEIPSGVNLRSTPQQAMADWQDITGTSGDTKPIYLKHKIENNIIKESYLEFVVTSEMASANPGMTAGTYTLRGGINESKLASKPIFEANKQVLLKAFGSSHCKDYTLSFDCQVPDLVADADHNGNVGAGAGDGGCELGLRIGSHCE
jgi:prepilin-type N-terminal cleavage/methylation domain-containing protein